MAKKEKEKESLDKEIMDFLSKSVSGISVEALDGREQVPYWIDGGHYALNWVVSNSFTKGALPGTKAVIVQGECLDGDTLIDIEIENEEFLTFFQKL